MTTINEIAGEQVAVAAIEAGVGVTFFAKDAKSFVYSATFDRKTARRLAYALFRASRP